MNDSLAGVEYEPTECSFRTSGIGSEGSSFLHDTPGLLRDVDQYILRNNPAVAEFIRSGRSKERRTPIYETPDESEDADDEYESEEYLVVQDPNLEETLSTATTLPYIPEVSTETLIAEAIATAASSVANRQPSREYTGGDE